MGSLVAEIAERVASSSAGARSELEIRGGAASPGTLLLSTAETTVVDGNKLGQIDFQAPVDSAGTDAILVGASIYAEADDTFAADNNATELVFATGASEAAAEKMRLTSDGKVGIGTSVPVTDLTIDGTITLKEQADADGDTAAYGQIWVNTATPCELYFTTDAGNDVQITDGSALAGAFDTDAAQVFNESGADVDFRIESDDNVNMFFVDGSEDKIGIGTSAPGAQLDIRGPTGTGTASAGVLRLSTAETTVVDGDQLGRIEFIAPLEASGTDAILVGASIHAESDDTFAADNNATELVFSTNVSAAASEKMRITKEGYVRHLIVPRSRAYLNGSYFDIPTGSHVIIPFTADRLSSPDYSTSNKRFTAPVTGLYLVSFGGTVEITGSENYSTCYVKVNGSSVNTARHRASGSTSEYVGSSTTTLLSISASDYIEIWGYSQAGNGRCGGDEFEFTVVFLG